MEIWIDFSLVQYILYLLILQLLLRHGICQMLTPVRFPKFSILPEANSFWTFAICDKYPVCCCSVNISFKIEQHNIFLTSQDIVFHLISTPKRIFTLEREVLVECNRIISTFPKKVFPHSFARWQREMKEARRGEHRIYKGRGREWDPVGLGSAHKLRVLQALSSCPQFIQPNYNKKSWVVCSFVSFIP